MNAQPLWDWINERHAIYQRRFIHGAPAPWTQDPILQQYRFCNVFRELDTVTIWIRHKIREPLKDHPLLWFWLAAARNINWPDSLESLIQGDGFHTGYPDEFHAEDVIALFKQRASDGKKNFGSAYVITNGGRPIPKEQYVCQYVLQPLWEARAAMTQFMEMDYTAGHGASLQRTWERFRQYEGFGPFIAYEVVTDLRHTRYLSRAQDIYTWANAGPGAKRGINRLWGVPADTALSPNDALQNMRLLMAKANNRPTSPLGEHVPLLLEMRDIEHSLCETDKYLRAKTGEGRPKQQFRTGAVYG